MKRNLTICISLVSVAIYVASLFYPVFQCKQGTNWEGYGVLVMGWVGLLTLDPRWLLNLLFFLITLSNISPTKIKLSNKPAYSIVLILGASTALFIPALSCGEGPGAPGLSVGLVTGGYLWVSALILGGLAVFIEASTPNPSLGTSPTCQAKPT